MAIRKIIHLPDPRLRQVSKPVETIDNDLQTLIDDMFDTMYDAKGVGLAAPQIGINLRLSVVDVIGDKQQQLVLINPEIIDAKGSKVYQEGCLSVPGAYDDVVRAESVTIRALDRTGQSFEMTASELLGECFQHEIDHLNGKLFVDLLSPLKTLHGASKNGKILTPKSQNMMAIKHQSLRIVFAGTPAFGLPCLDALNASQHQLVGIYTQPDRPAGRGKHPQCSAVKTWGAAHHIPVHQPLNFKDIETQNRLAAIKPDLMIVIAYGLILPASVLAIPQFGCINVHASILPRWRGASPIQQALLHGDTKTGITIMQMDEGMDTGEIFTMITTPITSKDNAQSVHDRLSTLSCAPLLETINNIAMCGAQTTPQPSTGITYAPKIKKSDAIIHWQTPSSDIDCMIRAFNPWPIAQTYAQHQPLRIHEAHVVKQQTTSTPGTILSLDKTGLLVATAKDCLKITKLQWPGGKVISVADYQNGARRDLEPGMILK